MTATDSSHLGPDIHDANTAPTQHIDTMSDGTESSSVVAEFAQPAATSAPTTDRVSDAGQTGSEERPRATRVAEGA